ncbi:MAG: PilZ domain-containing protein [Pseudobdellovibrionaceae bacterium]
MEGRFRSQEVTAMSEVGDKFKGLITGATYVVKKIEGKMVLLEEENGKSQVLTELSNLKLFYDKEKRKYPRFNAYWPIQYNQIGSSISHDGRVTNLSEGGMLIQSPGQMETGQHLKSKLSFILGSEINTIEMQAEVVWKDIYLKEARGDYRCGVRFIDISPEDMANLKSFLRRLSR